MKACPFCAEEIQDEAIVCQYCNRDLPNVEITKVQKDIELKHIHWPVSPNAVQFQEMKKRGSTAPVVMTFCGVRVSPQKIGNDNPTCADCISKHKVLASEMLSILGGKNK